ncbi:hypothetical protein LTR08_007359 [Meristemomyces frigidus]|nr:hypothetical protein LTR08_007359 [Meristemomyces frigidus]
MSVARWSLRLPRATVHLAARRTLRPRISAIPPAHQTRHLQTPPPRSREPAANDDNTAAQLATTLAETPTPSLTAPVHIPADPHSVLPAAHPALSILGNSSLFIQRQIEMMNIMLGFEQANRYTIMNGAGETLGYIAEQDHGMGSAIGRQVFKTHRSFTTMIFDQGGREVLRVHRPFAYINSRIRIYDALAEGDTAVQTAEVGHGGSSAEPAAQTSPLKLDEMRIIGEAQQQWAPLRRKYNLFTYRALAPSPVDNSRLASAQQPTSDTTAVTPAASATAIEASMHQFAHVNEPFLSWDFTLKNEQLHTVGSVNRNFSGFAREIFTDTGVYALRMDAAAQASVLEGKDGEVVAEYERDATGLTLDQRAVVLATAVSIDFDYFSRHSGVGSGGGMGFMPIWWPWGGGGAAAEGAAGAGAAGAGTAVEGAAGVAGRGVAGAGVGGAGAMESGIAGAGTMAGYEAMQRGVYGPSSQSPDGASPTSGAGAGDGGASPANGEGSMTEDGEPVFDPDGLAGRQGQGDQSGEESWLGGSEGGEPWGGDRDGGSAGGDGGGESGGGSGWADTLSDFFGGDD